MTTITTHTISEAAELFDASIEAECIDGLYQITGKTRHSSIPAAVEPWDHADLLIRVMSDELRGWGDYTHFLRIETTSGSHRWNVMARAK